MAIGILEMLGKFFSPKDEIHKHWYAPIDNYQFSTSEFYGLIEKELEARKVPGLTTSRMEFKEGGILSDNREYLRLQRERLVFDICAAPFGTSYFFSFRFVEKPLVIRPLDIIICFFGFSILLGLLLQICGFLDGLLAFIIIILGSIWLMRNTVALGLKDLDNTLLKTPVIGPIYELLFRKETYYREDTRLMYLSTVNSITEKVVEDVTAAKGIKLIKIYDRGMILSDLYRARTFTIST